MPPTLRRGLPGGGLTPDHPRRIVSRVTGNEMRRLREKRGWTQQELADALGLHVNTVARLERGELRIREAVARLTRLVASKPRGSAR
jgi:DNA-binding transcriptional regulator YiaG